MLDKITFRRYIPVLIGSFLVFLGVNIVFYSYKYHKIKSQTSIVSSVEENKLEYINNFTSEDVKIDPRLLSFDYKISYPFFSKPYRLPYRVYDDGAKTYISMNETVLHMSTPVLFNKRNERINYFVDKNLIVINELFEKVTLRIGKEEIVILNNCYHYDKTKRH